MDLDMQGNTAAFEQTVRSTLALAADFTDADWNLPTDCPGWTVRDQVSHIIGVERLNLGDPQPEHELPADLPHVRSDFGRILEAQVDVRRGRPGEEIRVELAQTLDRRLAQLAAADPLQQVICPDGKPGPYSRFMKFRAFDCWIHEQDIRRAVGRPGNLDAPAADRAWDIMRSGLGFVVGKQAKAAPGQSVAFLISGPPDRRTCVLVGDDGRARPAEATAPTLTLRMSWDTYVRLAAGRTTPDTVEVTVEGDKDLATRVLAKMTVTP